MFSRSYCCYGNLLCYENDNNVWLEFILFILIGQYFVLETVLSHLKTHSNDVLHNNDMILTYWCCFSLRRLPVPWIIFSAVHQGAAMEVSKKGLFCSVLLLFLMLIAVVAAIAISKWRMSKLLGATMFLLYVVFLVLSLLVQYGEITCPA